MYPKLFAGSKYAERLPIGEDSIISGFKPDVIRRYYKDWYRPDLMAVIIVGDIDPSEAEKMVKKHFSTLKPVASPRKREMFDVPSYTSSDRAGFAQDIEVDGTLRELQARYLDARGGTTGIVQC